MRYNRIYLTKSDVWSYAPHWMSSASRDIFYIFYKSIRATFKNQFEPEEIKALTEKIFFLREWHVSNMKEINSKIKEKKTDLILIPYKEGRKEAPKDYEYLYFDDEFHEDVNKELIYPNIIYNDFKDFFTNAQHGFEHSELTCKELYYYFMQDVTYEKLEKQYLYELSNYHKKQQSEISAFKRYLKSGSTLSFHRWNILDFEI